MNERVDVSASITPDIIPAEIFPPHEFVKEEMQVRGWRVEDLAEQAGWTTALTSEVLAGRRRVTMLIAVGLAQAFGTSVELWRNLQGRWEQRQVAFSQVAIIRFPDADASPPRGLGDRREGRQR